MTNDDEAEVSFSLSSNLTPAENEAAEAITAELIRRGLTNRPIWGRTGEGDKIEFRIASVNREQPVVEINSDAFVQREAGEIAQIIVQELSKVGCPPSDQNRSSSDGSRQG